LAGGRSINFEDLGYPKSDVLGFAALSDDGVGTVVSGVASRSALIVGEKRTPFTHEKFSVTALAAAAEGKLFAMGSIAGEVRLIDPEGKTVFAQDAKAGAVTSLAISRRGDAFAVGTGDGSVKIYRNDPWWVKASAVCGAMVYALGWSPDGGFIAAASGRTGGGRVSLFDSKTGKTLAKLDLQTRVYAVAFSKKGDRIALGCEDGVIRVRALRR
jgi:WD40 repeat protein